MVLTLPSSLFAQEVIPLVNPSFEEAGGTNPCTEARDFNDVPGWSMDSVPANSGVSQNANATDGVCGAWLFSGDPELWQSSDHQILVGKIYTLQVDARSSWQGELLEISLFYEWGGLGRTPFASTQWDFEGISEPMITLTLTVASDDNIMAYGWNLGVSIKNATPGSGPGGYHDDAFHEIDNVRLTVADATAIEDESIPHGFVLDQNYPNPFNPETTIGYDLKDLGSVRLTIHDALGRTVRTLVESTQAPGAYRVTWDGLLDDGSRATTGIYLYRLTVDRSSSSNSRTRAMMLLR